MNQESISTENLIKFIEDSMEKGKQSLQHGWSMNNILLEIHNEWGLPAYNFSRDYIIKNYGPMKESSQ